VSRIHIASGNYWAAVCTTVRPMLSDRCLDTEVGIGPGDIVLDGDPGAPAERGTPAPLALARWPTSATAERLL